MREQKEKGFVVLVSDLAKDKEEVLAAPQLAMSAVIPSEEKKDTAEVQNYKIKEHEEQKEKYVGKKMSMPENVEKQKDTSKLEKI